jgi:hypothetical protein
MPLRNSVIGGHDQPLEQQRWIDVGGDNPGSDAASVGQFDARRPASVDQHLPDRRVGQDLHASREAGLGHGLRDGAHATDSVTPGALLTAHLAKRVVQQHVGRAGAVGTGIVADHRIEAEGSPDRRTFEPAIQETAGALGEQAQQVTLAPQGQRRQPDGLAQAPQHARHGIAQVGLDLLGQTTQKVADLDVEKGLYGRSREERILAV